VFDDVLFGMTCLVKEVDAADKLADVDSGWIYGGITAVREDLELDTGDRADRTTVLVTKSTHTSSYRLLPYLEGVSIMGRLHRSTMICGGLLLLGLWWIMISIMLLLLLLLLIEIMSHIDDDGIGREGEEQDVCCY
jgi:hypothetical protein